MTTLLRRSLSRTLVALTGVLLVIGISIAPASAQRAPASAQPKTTAPQAQPKSAAAQPKANPAFFPPFGPGDIVLPYNRKVWAQTFSDVTPDPNIRYGTLPNGMRYAIMKNATPPGQASLRMVVQAGSLMERDDQQGLAHFLEHMAFNGSTHVKEGDMVPMLERLGLAFGADTNASTGDTQTVYKLDLPRTNDETVDTSLMLFREAAGELTIAQDAMNRERGVVLSEERSRDEPEYRLYKSELAFVAQDSLVVRRMPIGLPDILRNAPAQAIKDYYRAYYRPERTTLVAVGDFDVATMENKIKARFSDWTAAGPAGAEPHLILPIRRGPETKVTVEPGSRLDISINWVSPPDLSPDSKATRTADMIEGFGFAVLNRRFERLGRAANPPFTDGGAFVDTLYDTQKRVDIDMTGQPGRWREALTAAITEQRRMVQFGVTKAELDREIAEARTGLVASVQRASTRSTPGLANMIAGSVDASAVVTNPQQDLDFFNEAVRQVTVDSVNAAMRQAFAGAGPLAFIGTPTPIEGGASAVTDALNTALAAPVTPGETVAVKTWPYTRFGTPGKVKDSQVVADLDTTFIQFENGVRLTVKPTTFRKDQILVSVRLGAGMLAFPNNKTPADWALSGTFMEGGLKDLTAEEVERIMADKVVGVSMGAGENSTSFSGGTRGADLDTEMQMLAAYVTAPGWRPEGFQRIKTTAGTSHDQQDATAGGVLGRELNAMLRAGDRRWGFPTREEIAAAQLSDVKALVENDLANGPVEIIIVGDTTVAKATAAVAATFGALPKRPTQAWKAPPAPVVNFPAPTPAPVTLTHKGRADDSEGFIAWKTNDFFADVHEARSLRVAAAIMDNRLVEELREKQGATYSPSASSLADSVFPGYGFVAASVETPPDNLPGFFSTVESVAADLRDKLVSDDELNRAKAPMIEATQRNFNSSNEFWLTQLTDAQTDPRHLTAIRSAMADLRTISAADVQAAARKYLLAGRAWKLQVRAAPAASGPRQ